MWPDINLEPRKMCVFLLDTSESVSGETVDAMKNGLLDFKRSILNDALVKKRVETSIINFGDGVHIRQYFSSVDNILEYHFEPRGTPGMGLAIQVGLDLVAQRKAFYKEIAIEFYRPHMFLVTGNRSSEPEEFLKNVSVRLEKEVARKALFFHSIGARETGSAFDSVVSWPALKYSKFDYRFSFRPRTCGSLEKISGDCKEVASLDWAADADYLK